MLIKINQILDSFLDTSMNNSELAYMAANLRKNKRAKMTIVTVGKQPDKHLKIREKQDKMREASNSSDEEGGGDKKSYFYFNSTQLHEF